MGLLDRWSKKRQEEQLKDMDKKRVDLEVETKDEEKKSKKDKIKKSEKKEDTTKKVTKQKKTGFMGDVGILRKAIISEKAAGQEVNGVYAFIVDKKTSKLQIKRAIFQAYGIMPKKVRVMNMEGKKVRFGRQYGRRSDWKKALVTLPKGKIINIHEGV